MLMLRTVHVLYYQLHLKITTGDSHQEAVKHLFREPRSHLTSNNSVKNTIIFAVSCLVESKSNMVE